MKDWWFNVLNYQPLNWADEWKLFVYNIKTIWSCRNTPMIGTRINRATYVLCLFFFLGAFPLSFLFISPFIRFDIVSRDIALYWVFFIHMIALVCCCFLLGRRLQDWGIPQSVVLLIIGVCVWITYEMGDPLLFDFSHPTTLVRGKAGYTVALDLPQYVTWMEVVYFLVCLLPDNRKDNRFGKPIEPGIILFGRCVSNPMEKSILSYQVIYDFDDIKREVLKIFYGGKILLTESLNFRGRSSGEELGIVGVVILGVQFISSIYWYSGRFEKLDSFVVICMILHILLFIPSISFFTRRLHDCYCSAFWIPFMYIPVLNLFVYAILLFGKSWEIEDFHLEKGDR